MRQNAVRALLLAALALVLCTPAFADDPPACPSHNCFDLGNQCTNSGPARVPFYVDTGYTCKTAVGDIVPLKYTRCCQVPGCTQIFLTYCIDDLVFDPGN